jgi:putative transposase
MRPPRLRGFPYVGRHRYSLTLNSFDTREHFANPDLVADVREQFLRTASELKFTVHAYCFMREHLHLLVEGTARTSDLRGFVATAKQRAAFAARQWIRGRLWQPGYYDRVLRPGEELTPIARYILLNRVHAGVAASVLDEPFVGSETMEIDEILRLVGEETV